MYYKLSFRRRTLKMYPAVKRLMNLAYFSLYFILIIDETSDNSFGAFSTAIIKGNCCPFTLINRVLINIHNYDGIPLQHGFI